MHKNELYNQNKESCLWEAMGIITATNIWTYICQGQRWAEGNHMTGCAKRKKEKNSLCLRPDLSVHYGCSGDAAGQWVNLKQATHGWWPDRVGHLTVLTLIQVICCNLRKWRPHFGNENIENICNSCFSVTWASEQYLTWKSRVHKNGLYMGSGFMTKMIPYIQLGHWEHRQMNSHFITVLKLPRFLKLECLSYLQLHT